MTHRRTQTPFSTAAIARLRARESALYAERNARSQALAAQARECFFAGVPMHWMSDWPVPFPLFIAEARGASLLDADGHRYADFCLGDTGAMFGHSPAPIARALAEQAARGLTAMLPGIAAASVGAELTRRFGLPSWQIAATATDANRFMLRWVRAVTGRPVILVFDGCYHGAVDDTQVKLAAGRTAPARGLLGQVIDYTATTRVIEFNDRAALEAALAPGDVAAVLCEPALTNMGLVLEAALHLFLLNRGIAITPFHNMTLVSPETNRADVHALVTAFDAFLNALEEAHAQPPSE